MLAQAAKRGDDPRIYAMMATGWIKTALGGANAPPTIAESFPRAVATADPQREVIGLHFLIDLGESVAR